jgi:hypothetical protein
MYFCCYFKQKMEAKLFSLICLPWLIVQIEVIPFVDEETNRSVRDGARFKYKLMRVMVYF